MTPPLNAPTDDTRRKLVKAIGSALIVAPLFGLTACGGGGGDDEGTAILDDTSDSGTDDTDTGSDTDTSTGSDTTISWASGGTAAMTVDFPDDSLFETTAACTVALTTALTQGPCYFSSETLDDISEDQGGLPMQLCLRVIDSDCNPVSGLEVEVWHCDVEGIYSGDTSDAEDNGADFNTSFCTDNDQDALKSKWFRGYLVTDSSGRVNFKTCFPGWYSSRTIHIHFKVKNNNTEEVISQFCFPDELTEEICTTHSEYKSRGIQDTTLASGKDTVFGSDYDDFVFDWQQNSDGSLLAWKTIQIS